MKNGVVIKNKAYLVAQEHIHVEGIDFNEIFTLVTRLESIRMFISIACTLNLKLHHINMKSVF